MRKKSVLAFLIVMAILLVSSNVSESQSDYVETWVPYVPYSLQIDLEFWMVNQTAYINITMTFPTPCYDIASWGDVTKDGYIFWVDSEIWRWTGICIQVIWSISYTYELGDLESGNYTFTFKAWSIDIKSIDFTVTAVATIDPILCDINEDGIVNMRDTSIAARAFGSYPSHPRWNPIADINQDNTVDMKDIAPIARNFGKTV